MSMRHWIWFSTLGLSIKSELKLLDRFETPENIYDETEQNLKQVLKPGEVAAILSNKSLDRADNILAECISKNIQILTIRDAQYPDRLRNIDDPPVVLYHSRAFAAFETPYMFVHLSFHCLFPSVV